VSTVAHTSTTLAAHGVTKRFGARTALDGISFSLGAGELVAVIGPNGAGKTTLLSILAGVASPSSGSVSSQPSGGRIGWVPQQPAVYSKLSVAENLRLFARLEKLPDVDSVVARMLSQTGLVERADDEVGKLSGGNQQRVNIAIGLLCEPVALLLDEPSSSLDPRQREVLWEFIGALAGRGTTVVYSTHNVAEAERYADRVLVLVEGSLVFGGSAAELERTVAAADVRDFEAAFVRFLALRGAG
jgi:ABC-2 type transport system ATP-binding protein